MGYAVAVAVPGSAVREVASKDYGSRAPGSDGPDSLSFDDVLEALGDEIAMMAAHLHAGRYRFLRLIARFDRMDGWKRGGHRNCACWLSLRTGLDPGTAREHVRVARALENLPDTRQAMSRGELSFSQVRALTRVAAADTESDLLDLAVGCTTEQLERVVRAYKMGTRRDEAARERERHESRTLSMFPNDEGMYVVRGLLEADMGVLVMRAVEAANDALYRGRPRTDGAHGVVSARDTAREAAQRRADAMGLVAERVLTVGFGAPGDHSDGHGGEVDPAEARPAPPISGTRAERYQVMLHVDSETLAAEGEPGRSELEDGTRVSAGTSRRLSCDAALVRVKRSRDGSVLDVGRRTRTIPPAIRRALEVRDRGCRFPGCGLRFTDAHHVVHWADGGETSLRNTVLLCRHHHRLVHEGGWSIETWGNGRLVFRDPRGSASYDGAFRAPRSRQTAAGVAAASAEGPSRMPAAARADALVEGNRRRGVDPGAWTAGARWKREADIPFEVLCRATEAAL